jgi:hypothetical protein
MTLYESKLQNMKIYTTKSRSRSGHLMYVSQPDHSHCTLMCQLLQHESASRPPSGFWCLNDKMIKKLMSFAKCETEKMCCNYTEVICSSRDMLWTIHQRRASESLNVRYQMWWRRASECLSPRYQSNHGESHSSKCWYLLNKKSRWHGQEEDSWLYKPKKSIVTGSWQSCSSQDHVEILKLWQWWKSSKKKNQVVKLKFILKCFISWV